MQSSIKLRLTVMNFLQFAVWGAYLTSMGRYLGTAGFGSEIGNFYRHAKVSCRSSCLLLWVSSLTAGSQHSAS